MRRVIGVKEKNMNVCTHCGCEFDGTGWWVEYASDNENDDPFDLLKTVCDECAEKAKKEITTHEN